MSPNPLGLALRNKRVGPDKLVWARPDMQAPENFVLSSPAFEAHSTMPDQFRGRLFGKNTSPALRWTAPPQGTAELVLICEDADSPFGNPNTHALAAGIDPRRDSIREDGLTESGDGDPIKLGKAGPKQGWFGPMPIGSHGPHRYVFQIFAVDQRLELPAKFKLGDVLDAMAGHVIGRAQLEGTCEKG